MPVYTLSEDLAFPNPRLASREGLLAVGGDLSPERLLFAYSIGIFPWYNEEDPILWWSPDPRMVLLPGELHVSRSLRKTLRQGVFTIRFDTAFEQVIRACARLRESTWLIPEMIEAYTRLHAMGFAHSVEAWQGDRLCGGIYGVALDRAFFGESMFHTVSNASKCALSVGAHTLFSRGFSVFDCQVSTGHLGRMGAMEIPRDRFLDILARSQRRRPLPRGNWLFDPVSPA